MNTRDPNARAFNETTDKPEQRSTAHETHESGTAGESSGQSRERALHAGREMIGEATQTGKKMLSEAQERARSIFANQRDRAVGGLADLAETFRQVGNQLRRNERDSAAQYADRVADGVENFADIVRDKDMNELLDNAQDLARRRPGMFMGGAFVLGFMAARFLKSSRDHSSAMRRHFFHRERATHPSEGTYGTEPGGGGRYTPTEAGRYAETHTSPERERTVKV